jgi:tRNA threonylcarbamoyladenosine biosynthesis protein TsaE
MIKFNKCKILKTKKIAKILALEFIAGQNIFLFGTLGSGKTLFSKEFIKTLLPETNFQGSPTYSLQKKYQNQTKTIKINHYDLYRLNKDSFLPELEEDLLNPNQINIIEWSENLKILPSPRTEIHFKKTGEKTREILIKYIGYHLKKEQTKKIWQKYKPPKNVQEHIKKVNKVSVYLYNYLKNKYILDKNIIKQSANFHDLLRYIDFNDGISRKKFPQVKNKTLKNWQNIKKEYQNLGHGEACNLLLKKIGFPLLGSIIKKHQDIFITEGFLNTYEKILFYADLSCKHNKIVSTKERLKDLKLRYPKPQNPNFWQILEKISKNLEKEWKLPKNFIDKIKD